MGEKIAVLLIGLVLPGGGTIAELFFLLKHLADDMRGSRAMCTRVLERIEFLYNHVEKIQDDGVLKHNDVLPKLATTITRFKTFMEVHSKKKMVSRYLARHEVADQILAFSSDLDAISVALNLTSAAEITKMQTELSGMRTEFGDLRTELANTHALMKEYPGRQLREMVNAVEFAIERNGSAGTPQISAEDVALLQRTMDAIIKQSNLTHEALPPWYLPSDCIQCHAKPFAEGTYGKVHHGKWNGTDVVIKKLLLSAENSEVEKNFFSEVAIWHKIGHHPHVIQLYGACHASTPPFFVCEDAKHGDFVDFFGKSESHKQQMWRRFYEAALGVAHLHANDVVHGDLKCRNLLIGSDGVTKICDFGFSFIQSKSRTISVKAQTDATRWKALECLNGEEHTPQNPQYKSDVYSLGMCIIEAVSGNEPWPGLDEDKILDALDDGKRHEIPATLTDRQRKLVEAMTEIEVTARMSLSDALMELKALADEEEAQHQRLQCQFESIGSAKFCSECAHPFTGSELRVLPVP